MIFFLINSAVLQFSFGNFTPYPQLATS